MEFKVTTEFEGQTVVGKIEEKSVQLERLLGREYETNVPIAILEDLIKELQSVVFKVKELKEEKTKSDVNDEFQHLEDTLGNASKLFESVIDVGTKTNMTSQNIADVIRKELKDKGFNIL